ncbi:Signal transduction histidine kinase CheA [hydrothermal vent metagenome]|uniref:histidine kinase n=1 Tax=hydrothermal vent metagenome TaxID=652676 RepID=A0A3B0ZHQ5_9ZZZZ
MGSSDFSMLNLLRTEVTQQGAALGIVLDKIKNSPNDAELFDEACRAASALKGAAKLVDVKAIHILASRLETLFQILISDGGSLFDEHLPLLNSVLQQIEEIAALDDEPMQGFDVEQPAFVALLSQLDKVEIEPAGNGEGAAANAQEKVTIDSSMLEMFRDEVKSHGSIMADCLLVLDDDPGSDVVLEKLMRAAHSVKGAARLVGVDVIVRIAHIMEDAFVAAQNKKLTLSDGTVDLLLSANDRILAIAALPETSIASWAGDNEATLKSLLAALNGVLNGDETNIDESLAITPIGSVENSSPAVSSDDDNMPAQAVTSESRVLKVTADRWDSMMGLAGEIKVESGWLVPYLNNMMVMRKKQQEMSSLIEGVREFVASEIDNLELNERVSQVHNKIVEFRNIIVDQMNDLDQHERRISSLTERLHRQALSTRMRPFSDGVHGFQRMIRDIARSLKKKVKLELKGEATLVDRDVLEKMEAPLNHIIRNALDHGIESPEERIKSGKPERATITLSACHNEGMLLITVEDNGRGIDIEMLRNRVIKKDLVDQEMAASLNAEELLAFLFLPSFSTRDEVTDLSGRGVGLDVVMDAIQTLRGRVKVETNLGVGSKFLMRLPLTLSVVPGLLVLVANDYYAFPLSRIVCTAKVHVDEINVVEGHEYATINGQHISLLAASKVFELEEKIIVRGDYLYVIVITNHDQTYGIVVDKFVDQRELAIQTVDPRLGKVQDVSSTALLEDGSTVLIVDVDDIVQTIGLLVKGGRLGSFTMTAHTDLKRKSVLVVDDSLTVREVEKKLLEDAGFRVDVAVDGMDGWNAVRTKEYSLIICDIDMPRMNGIELVNMIKGNKQFSQIPVIIVSYKDREEDRLQGMDAGADYYLTKGSFHDDSFINAVHDLIGEASE